VSRRGVQPPRKKLKKKWRSKLQEVAMARES
jgi:hypothetical protein